MLDLLLRAPSPSPSGAAPAEDAVTWADALEAWATLGGAIVALTAAVATIWLLVHTINEARVARAQAAEERGEAAVDREMARQDREFAAAERRDAERAQARTVVFGETRFSFSNAPYGYLVLDDEEDREFFLVFLKTVVTNLSAQPVLAVRLLADSIGDPGQWPVEVRRVEVLGPGESLAFDGYVKDARSALGDTLEEAKANLVIEVAFTDAAGRRWRRKGSDQPRLVVA